MPHDLRQISGRGFKQQMIMGVHQTEYMNNSIVSFCCRFKIFKKLFPVTSALEYIFPFITSGSRMIKSTGIGYSQGTSH